MALRFRHLEGFVFYSDQSGVSAAGCGSVSQCDRTGQYNHSSWPWPQCLSHHQSPCRCVLKTPSGQDTGRKCSWIAACGNRKAEGSLSPRCSRVREAGSEQTSSDKQDKTSLYDLVTNQSRRECYQTVDIRRNWWMTGHVKKKKPILGTYSTWNIYRWISKN